MSCMIAGTFSCNAKTSDSKNGEEGVVEESEAPAVTTLEDVNPDILKVLDGMIIPEGKPCIVDFYATWCGPCKIYSPIFHEVAEEYNGQAIFLSIDVDKYKTIANRYEISSIPSTVFILPAGGIMGKEVGIISKTDLQSFVNQLLETNAGDGMGI